VVGRTAIELQKVCDRLERWGSDLPRLVLVPEGSVSYPCILSQQLQLMQVQQKKSDQDTLVNALSSE
jgi:hypothetical protein